MDIQEDGYIKCDSPSCDWTENIKLSEMVNWLNKPCPKCGENVLTEKDFDDFLRVLATIQLVDDAVETLEEEKVLWHLSVHNGGIKFDNREDNQQVTFNIGTDN